MQREILFRGRKWDNSDWVYGDLIQGGEDGSKWILPIEELRLTQVIKIMPETIGQYINYDIGDKVFEGDILKSGNGKLWIVKWIHQSWYVSNHDIVNIGLNKFAGNEVYTFHEYFKLLVKSRTDIIIVGNIYDNPELLQSL